jgi:hypothetical protein
VLAEAYPLNGSLKDFLAQKNLVTFKAYLSSFKPLAVSTGYLALEQAHWLRTLRT